MTTLVVTGAAGFTGSHFVRHWVLEHPADRVVVEAVLDRGSRHVGADSFEPGRDFVAARLEKNGRPTYRRGLAW